MFHSLRCTIPTSSMVDNQIVSLTWCSLSRSLDWQAQKSWMRVDYESIEVNKSICR